MEDALLEIPSGESSCPSAAPIVETAGSRSDEQQQKKRRRKQSPQFFRCSECGSEFDSYAGGFSHCTQQPTCHDAEVIPFDPEEPARNELQAKAGKSSFEADMLEHCVTMYSGLEYEKLVDRTCIQETIKEKLVDPMLEKVKNEVYRRLARDEIAWAELDEVIGSVFDVHQGIETSAKEETALKKMVKPVKPVLGHKRPSSNKNAMLAHSRNVSPTLFAHAPVSTRVPVGAAKTYRQARH